MKYYLIWLAIAVPVVTILFLGGFVVSSTTGGITFVVNSTADATDVNPGDGVCESGAGNGICTLRAAVQETNALPGADGIELPAGVYQLTIAGFDNIAQAGDLDITGSLLISGAGPAMTVVDGGALDRVFQLGSSATLVELSGLTIRRFVAQ